MVSKKFSSAVTIVALLAVPAWSQHVDRLERERAQSMLREVASDVRQHYYDPKLHGVDWDGKVSAAEEAIANTKYSDDLYIQIAAVFETLGDSHTVFIPPSAPIPPEYGWRFQMVGTRCFVTHVRPRSDAEAKDVRPGEEVLTIDGFTPARESLSRMEYALNVLLPRTSLRVAFRDESGKIRQVDVATDVRDNKTIMDFDDMAGEDALRLRLEHEDERRLVRPEYKELGKKLMILKLPMFTAPFDARAMIENARNHDCLIIDLRGNPGGVESALQDLLSGFFADDVKIADRISRDATKPVVAKGSKHSAFTGKLIVLVDSDSASAAEAFARVVQIEKRGIVLGDRTAGNVMEAQYYPHASGTKPVYTYGSSITTADLIMADGKSLEHVGVTPDEIDIPTATDLANNRDPVMTRAAQLAGVTLSPEEAGKLFPYEWPTN
jgi:carboxyl-terminal processing protease